MQNQIFMGYRAEICGNYYFAIYRKAAILIQNQRKQRNKKTFIRNIRICK